VSFDNLKALEGIIQHLKPGQIARFDRGFISEIWPPRGRALFQNIALAYGGNRPEPIESTLYQFQRWVDRVGGFRIKQNIQDGNFEVIKE